MKKFIILLAIAVILISMVGGATTPKVKEVREKYEAKLLVVEGVTGVAVDEAADVIIVLLEKPEISEKIPKVLDGVPVRFRVTGKIEALLPATALQKPAAKPEREPTTKYSRTGINRPVFGGISVGNPYITAGTLGLVTDDNFVLSNAHVLALDGNNNFLPLGTSIWQPGRYDGGTSDNQIGVLSGYIPIEFNNTSANNFADAAISTLTVDRLSGEVLNKQNNGFYPISDTTTVNVGERVRKSGRTTGVTQGNVWNTDATINVGYGSKTATFKHQIVILGGGFSSGGDSGSAVDKDGKFVGLLFAGSSLTTIVSKAEHILGPLGITI